MAVVIQLSAAKRGVGGYKVANITKGVIKMQLVEQPPRRGFAIV